MLFKQLYSNRIVEIIKKESLENDNLIYIILGDNDLLKKT
jgi:hypothetical protein